MRPLLFLALATSLFAADWPTYRADASRSGYTSETIPNQLRQRWAFRLPSGPRIAWPNSERMEYDRAFQPIIVGESGGVLVGQRHGNRSQSIAGSMAPIPAHVAGNS